MPVHAYMGCGDVPIEQWTGRVARLAGFGRLSWLTLLLLGCAHTCHPQAESLAAFTKSRLLCGCAFSCLLGRARRPAACMCCMGFSPIYLLE
jgi:hypothetical protein